MVWITGHWIINYKILDLTCQYLLCNNHEFLLDKLLVYIKNSQASAPKLSLVHTSPWTALSVILLAMEGFPKVRETTKDQASKKMN